MEFSKKPDLMKSTMNIDLERNCFPGIGLWGNTFGKLEYLNISEGGRSRDAVRHGDV
jgi:hypothetical protein